MKKLNIKDCLLSIDVATLLVSLYFTLAVLTYAYLQVGPNGLLLFLLFVGLLVGSYALFGTVIKYLRNLSFDSPQAVPEKRKWLVFSVSALVTFGLLMVWFFAYFPGSFSADSITTYRQAVTGHYSDWHPAWYTLFAQTLPLKLFGVPQATTIMQLIFFSLVVGFTTLTIYEMGNIKSAIVSLALIVFNPFNCYIVLYQWKDVTFSIAAMLCTTYALRLICKLSKPQLWKLVLYGFALASCTVFRHNAILFTAPLLLVLFFQIERKDWIKIIVVTVASLIIIKGPVYHAFQVEKPDRRVSETTGLFLSIIGNVAKETPERMDKELSEFAYSLASPEVWANYEFKYGFNSVKWNGADVSVVEEQGLFGMLHLTIKCFQLSPKASMDELINITDIVYGFESAMKGYFVAEIDPNDLGIAYTEQTNMYLQDLVSGYASFFNTSLFKYIRTFGVWMFVILLVYFSKLRFTSWSSWKKWFIILPLFAHNFGTMLLQTAPEARFFFVTYLIGPLLVVYALHKEENDING